jgi:enamine deaminase RidA (YjgF/YER057c/UK114 family)
MSAIKRYGTTRRWSEASVVNGMVFVAGQLADDTSLPFELQLA